MTSHRKDKRLSVLTDAEKFALYGLPDFDESQQLEFLSLSTSELELATNRPGLQAQVYCILQIGYLNVAPLRGEHGCFAASTVFKPQPHINASAA